MKYNIPNEFRMYIFFKTNMYYFLFLFVAYLLIYMFKLNIYFKIATLVIFLILFLNSILYFLLFKIFQKNSYLLIKENSVEYHANNFFLLYFTRLIIQNKNFVKYSITQTLLLKYFNLYKISISSGDNLKNIHISKENIVYFEKVFKDIIEQNSVLLSSVND